MSRPPAGRSSFASGLQPPSNYGQPPHGSSIFVPPPPSISNAPSRPQSRIEPPPLSATAGPMPGTAQRPIAGPIKRLIVLCDGTWKDSNNSIMGGQKQYPSNVSRMGWAIRETSRDGIPQIVYYQAGVGTGVSYIGRLLGGATGAGLKQNVSGAYTYLAVNYREGDQIFLMGFSRGAYTARSVGGLVGGIGLLTRTGLPCFNEIFEDYQHRYDDRYVSKFPDIPFEGKGRFDREYVMQLQKRGLTRLRIPIKAICCWDTVGSLGIPRISWLESLGIQSRDMASYQFYDTRLNPYVENAFQALALDERRGPFSPSLWEKGEGDQVNLKQVWFPGVHSNVGGGYSDQDLADLTLAWMISRLEPFLDFKSGFLMECWDDNRHYYQTADQSARGWSMGKLYNSFTGFQALAGAKIRTPGNYHRTDPDTGRPTTKYLKNTHEYIHASVRSRLGLQGPGVEDRGVYDPLPLKDWVFDVEPASQGQGGNHANGRMVVWTDRSGKPRDRGGQERMPEAVLLESELTLLRQSPRVEAYVRNMQPPPDREKRRTRRGDDEGAVYGANGAAGGPDGRRRRRDRGTSQDRARSRSQDPARERRRRSRRQDD